MAIGKEPIVLFGGGTDGYGDAINIGRDSYAWTMNFDCRSGRAVPSLAPVSLTGNFLAPVTAAFEWEDTDANNNIPFILIAQGAGAASARIAKILNGVISQEDAQGQDAYTDGVLYRYDQDATADPNEEMAWFCNGFSNNILVRRKKDGTIDTGATTTHTAKADRLSVVGQDLWRVEGEEGYEVSKLTLDTDPGIETNWGSSIPVGSPTWPIHEILPLGGSPIVLKGEGVFKYNAAPSSAVFQNLTPFITPHPDNGKGGFTDGRGRIYYPTADGHLLVITFGFQSSQTPTQFNIINRDTPRGRITALTADAEQIYAGLQPGFLRIQQLNLEVHSERNSVFTNHTSNVTDQSYATSADWTALTSATTDAVYVGADEPFWGIWFDLLSIRTSTGATFSNILYTTGNDSFQAITSSVLDSTHTWMRSGLMGIKRDSNEIVAEGSWVKSTITGIPTGSSLYWIKINIPTTDLSGVKVRAVSIVPYRPPLDPETFFLSGPAIAGALPHILVGKWHGERILWHDVWTLNSPEVEQLVIGRTPSAHSVGDRTLYAITAGGAQSEAVLHMPVGRGADPAEAPWPKLGDYGEAGVGMDEHVIAFSGHTFGMPHVPKKVAGRITIGMKHVQDDDEVWFIYWWDEDSERYYREGPLAQDGLVLEGLEGSGQILYSALMYKDGSRDAIAPVLSSVIIEGGGWESLEADQQPTREDTASPLNR